jgi:hypothetical protein
MQLTFPSGVGFIAAMSMNCEGKVIVLAATMPMAMGRLKLGLSFFRAASSSLQPSLRDLNALASGPNPESFRGWAIIKCPYGTNPGFRHELDAA